MLLTMLAQLKAKGFDGEKLVRELQVPAKAERYEEEGFKYHSDLGISVQGQSASDAWKEIDRLAKKWGIPEDKILVEAERQGSVSGAHRSLRSGGA
jgi:hypothetical protein